MNWLFLIRNTPYGSPLAREALDMAYAAAAFDQKVTLVFLDNGVYQLISNQDTSYLGRKNIEKTLLAAEMYEITDVYAHDVSLSNAGIQNQSILDAVEVINQKTIQSLINDADKVMSF